MFHIISVVGMIIILKFSFYEVQGDELLSVVVLYRHGDRTPTKFYPKDPYNNVSQYWPDGIGELTNNGIQRQYELGKWLRTRYSDFLPELFSTDDIYVRSSDRDRTLMSAEANLAGLYPPKKTQIWNQDLLWRPIPIHTVEESQDNIIAMKRRCPKYKLLYNELLDSTYFKKINEQNKELYDVLSKNTGWNITAVHQIETLYSLLSIEKEANLTLPSWTNGIFPEKLKTLAELSHASFSFTPELARLKNGPFFDYLFSHLDNIINNSSKIKMLMLSGHDDTVVNTLSGMGLYDHKCPEFAATIIWELRKNENGTYVKVFYKNNETLQNLKLTGCEINCNYSQFQSLLLQVTVNAKKWYKECYKIKDYRYVITK